MNLIEFSPARRIRRLAHVWSRAPPYLSENTLDRGAAIRRGDNMLVRRWPHGRRCKSKLAALIDRADRTPLPAALVCRRMSEAEEDWGR